MQVTTKLQRVVTTVSEVPAGTCYRLTCFDVNPIEAIPQYDRGGLFIRIKNIEYEGAEFIAGIIHSVRLGDGVACLNTTAQMQNIEVETLPDAEVNY